jgi:carboxyl-terminal processing protease
MSSRFKYFVVSTSTCLTLLLLVGSVRGKGASSQEDTLKHIGVFSDVVARIKAEYVEEPDMKAVTQGALNGMLEAIDPFASYLNAEQFRTYQEDQKAPRRGDVGLILSKKFGYLGVVGAIPGSPAAKAGLSTGDMIETIKGVSTRDMPLAYAGMLLQGESGTTIDMSVVRTRQPGDPQPVKLVRALPALPAVTSSMLDGQVAYINLDALGAAQVKQVADAVQKLQKEGAQKFILDVRNCAAGTPQDGIALANLFLSKGRIGYLQGQRYKREDFEADPAKAVTSLPLAVLANRGTASGAEIAAAALQDNKRAQLVGEPTYGDASLRQPVPMDDGGAIILSVAKYYSPNGQAIQDTRVTPGTAVVEAESQIEYDEDGEPLPQTAPRQEEQQKTPNDPVVKKALEILGAKG